MAVYNYVMLMNIEANEYKCAKQEIFSEAFF